MAIFWTTNMIVGSVLLCVFISVVGFGVDYTVKFLSLILLTFLAVRIIQTERRQ